MTPYSVSANVSVIDTSTNTEVLPRIPVEVNPFNVAMVREAPLTPNAGFEVGDLSDWTVKDFTIEQNTVSTVVSPGFSGNFTAQITTANFAHVQVGSGSTQGQKILILATPVSQAELASNSKIQVSLRLLDFGFSQAFTRVFIRLASGPYPVFYTFDNPYNFISSADLAPQLFTNFGNWATYSFDYSGFDVSSFHPIEIYLLDDSSGHGPTVLQIDDLRLAVADADSDGVNDDVDNCPTISNPDQSNFDGDSYGDACDPNSFAPEANNDSYSTNQNTPLTVVASGVLGNDTDADNNTLTAAIVSNPSHAASFTLNSNGSFSYTPVTNYVGPDSFTYRANDGEKNSNVATVSITVNDITPPTITITSPAANATYQLNASIGSSYGCADSGSGVASCQGPVANGSPIDTSSTGTKTFTVSSSDNVGNTDSTSVTYSVVSGGGGGSTSADLGITLSAPARVSPGASLTYSMTVSNGGKVTATGVIVSNTLPAGTVFASASASQGTITAPPIGSNGTVTVDLGTLANGATATVSIVATNTAPPDTELIDTATVTATTQDLNSKNNSATKKTTVSKK